jgi:hypothetical protein
VLIQNVPAHTLNAQRHNSRHCQQSTLANNRVDCLIDKKQPRLPS